VKILKPEDIRVNGNYQQVLAFPNDNPQDFIFKNLWPGGKVLKQYLLILLLLFIFFLLSVTHSIVILQNDWEPIFYFSFLGIFIGLTITVVMHELIQGYIFKKEGCTKNEYILRVKSFTFFVFARDFVYNKAIWKKITFYPLILINSLFLLFFIFFQTPLAYSFLVVVIAHSIFCIKDMIIWDQLQQGDDYLIFDSEKDNITYFYVRSDDSKLQATPQIEVEKSMA
jgi:hypothetical protein